MRPAGVKVKPTGWFRRATVTTRTPPAPPADAGAAPISIAAPATTTPSVAARRNLCTNVPPRRAEGPWDHGARDDAATLDVRRARTAIRGSAPADRTGRLPGEPADRGRVAGGLRSLHHAARAPARGAGRRGAGDAGRRRGVQRRRPRPAPAAGERRGGRRGWRSRGPLRSRGARTGRGAVHGRGGRGRGRRFARARRGRGRSGARRDGSDARRHRRGVRPRRGLTAPVARAWLERGVVVRVELARRRARGRRRRGARQVREPTGRPGADGGQRDRGRPSRRRHGHRVGLDAGAVRRARRPRRRARGRQGRRAHDRARRRRRVRREAAGLSRVPGGGRGRREARAAGAVDRVALGGHGRPHARPRTGAAHRDRRASRRHAGRLAGRPDR